MSASAHLLIVSPSLGEGGAERVASLLATHVDRERFAPHLCILRGPVDYPVPQDVPVIDLNKSRPWHIPRTIIRLRRTIREIHPDVVLSMTSFASVVTGLALTLQASRPRWIARIASNPTHDPYHERYILRHLYKHADAIVGNSHGSAIAFEHVYHRLPDVIANPVVIPPEQSRPAVSSRRQVNVLFVGRLSQEKRPDLAISSFAQGTQGTDATLTICGDGPLRRTLEQQVRDLGISKRVTFTGFERDIHARYADADIFLLTSDFEGLPNALVEAQACGLPAVSTDCPHGPSEILIHGVTGFLVPVNTVSPLAQYLSDLATSAALRAQMSGAARQHVATHYGPTRVFSAWHSLFERVLPASSHLAPNESPSDSGPR